MSNEQIFTVESVTLKKGKKPPFNRYLSLRMSLFDGKETTTVYEALFIEKILKLQDSTGCKILDISKILGQEGKCTSGLQEDRGQAQRYGEIKTYISKKNNAETIQETILSQPHCIASEDIPF